MIQIHQKFSDTIHLIIISVLSFLGFYFTLSDQGSLLTNISQYLPLLVIAFVIIWAALKNKGLVAYLLLLMTFYPNGISDFVNWAYGLFSNGPAFSLELLISFLVTLFLLLMVISYIFELPKPNKLTVSLEVTAILVYFGFYVILSGVTTAMYNMVIPGIILLFGSSFLGLSYLVARLIGIPFTFLETILQGNGMTVNYAMRNIIAIGILVFISMVLIKNISSKGYNK